MDPSRPESPAEAKARRIREDAARRRPPVRDQPGGTGDPVAAALRSLPPGWSQVGVVAGDGPGRVLVGPGGVAVVWAVTPDGPLTLQDGVLLEGGQPSTAAAAAVAATGRLRELGGSAARRTTAVLCVPSAVPLLRGPGVLVCGAEDLARVLTGGPVVLGPGEVAGAGIRLAAALRRTRGAGADRPSRGRLPTVVVVLLSLVLLAALLLLAPRLGEGLGSARGHCPTGSSSC